MNPELADLAKWAMQQPIGSFKWLAVYDFGFISTAIIYREGQFQIEMILANPGMRESRTLHRHPNVDAVALGLFGSINGIKGGAPETCSLKTAGFVDRFSWHGLGEPLVAGAVALSVQEWFDIEPNTSIGLNWEGSPFSKKQRRMLRTIGAPVREPGANGLLSVQAQGGVLGGAQVAPPEIEER